MPPASFADLAVSNFVAAVAVVKDGTAIATEMAAITVALASFESFTVSPSLKTYVAEQIMFLMHPAAKRPFRKPGLPLASLVN